MSTTSPSSTSSANRLFTDAKTGKVHAKGSSRQEAAGTYLGRDTRALRRTQHAAFYTKQRTLTAAERGAIRTLSNGVSRDGSTGGR